MATELALKTSDFETEVLQSQVPDHVAGRLEIRSVPAEDADLPQFDLLYAGYSLPFLGADAFDRFWSAVRDRLRPGGILIVNFFGPRDSWAGRDGMRFIDVVEVRRLVDGLELLALDEEDQDGDSFLGPKHWHVFDVIARQPAGDIWPAKEREQARHSQNRLRQLPACWVRNHLNMAGLLPEIWST